VRLEVGGARLEVERMDMAGTALQKDVCCDLAVMRGCMALEVAMAVIRHFIKTFMKSWERMLQNKY